MSSYLACDLGAENGRVILATLDAERLTLAELRRIVAASFPPETVTPRDPARWDEAAACFARVSGGKTG